MIVGTGDLAKYPFMDEVKTYLKESGLTLDDLGSDDVFADCAKHASSRIEHALDGKILKESEHITTDASMQIFSFTLALVMLRIINSDYLIRKFALAEARRAETFLDLDLVKTKSNSIVLKILRQLFSSEIKMDGNIMLIPIALYLVHSSQFNEPTWKLVNRNVYSGFVHLSIHETVRLIRRELIALITKKIRNAPAVNLYDTHGVCKFTNLESHVSHLRERLKEFVVDTNTSTDIPPCISEAIKMLESGQNLSHSGRFMLASFLLTRSWTADDVANLFVGAPDFNRNITKYQIQMIEKGGYKCPGCSKLKSQNLCRRTDECGTIINPLQFRKRDR